MTAICLNLAAIVPGCASEVYVPLPPSRPLPMDGVTYAYIGREALAQYGYEEIIRSAVDAGVLYYPTSEQPNGQNFIGQTMAEAGRQAWPVFTQWALAAGFASQLDSPAPGPADVAAIGMLVAGLVHAGIVGTMVLTSTATATATPVPTATPIPTAKPTTTTTAPPIATPTTTTTAPPIALPRRHPRQTCENTRLDELENAKDAVCPPALHFPGKSCSDSKVSQKVLDKYPCSLIKARLVAVQVCLAARQKVQDECFKNATDARHAKAIQDYIQGIATCEALKLLNCAPGHPMSGR